MTDADVKAINIILEHITKTIMAQTEKILRAVEANRPKQTPGPKRVHYSTILRRARAENTKLRRENHELHRLLEKEINKAQ